MTIAISRRRRGRHAHACEKNWATASIADTVVCRCRTCGSVLRKGSMSAGNPRVYTSFAEFEREELRRLDSLHTSVDDLVEERFAEELDFGQSDQPRRRGRPRKHPR